MAEREVEGGQGHGLNAHATTSSSLSSTSSVWMSSASSVWNGVGGAAGAVSSAVGGAAGVVRGASSVTSGPSRHIRGHSRQVYVFPAYKEVYAAPVSREYGGRREVMAPEVRIIGERVASSTPTTLCKRNPWHFPQVARHTGRSTETAF